MIFSNLLVICTMSIQGKGLTRGTSHDEMVRAHALAPHRTPTRTRTLAPSLDPRPQPRPSPSASTLALAIVQVETFGLTWLLSGTALGHIVGAGAILGCSSAGFF